MESRRRANLSMKASSKVGAPRDSATVRSKFPVSFQFSSMAEENNVRSYNKSSNKVESLPTNEPQRIQLPLFFNTPCRIKPPKVKQRARNISAIELDKTDNEIAGKPDNGVVISSKRRLKDYEMLAYACKRGGKVRDEGRACFSMGVLYDNMGNFKSGIRCYQRFLAICKQIGDAHGQSLAYNCIGVNYQMLGEKQPELLHEALKYHKQHEQLADVNGKFLASINMGLCYDRLCDSKNSIYYFQNALKYSVKMSSVVGQSIAIGNIGRIGAKGLHDNRDKMKLFLEKYVQLSEQLKDTKGQAGARLKLGLLTGSKHAYDQGKVNFQRALQMAQQMGQQNVYDEAKCGLAVTNAQLSMRRHLKDLSSSFVEQRQE